ncbi:DNA sulfur modification protein DndB [Bradyrhizobium sp. AUGA SZCCT0177]|uniref:DNA sulfur modification protein DndB n=1 Tax=Bradyrhizobium sp. AUGA SZCCT0177 TaxID=2807665 RepID=UPI001BA63A87|nr:DNA sulfur modification protein DndB [Bradyrhizobium sp. AUGA SZCCT0177]
MADSSYDYEYTFPAIRGTQAGRDYYVSMCPLRLIPKIFVFNEEELLPELRAQRLLNKARVPEIAQYLTSNRNSYVFSAITASIDADVRFVSAEAKGESARIGLLQIPMSAHFVINDGQHRRAAIELALRDHPELGNETIAVVFFLDVGLTRCQQMFADLNRYAVRPSRSIGVLYDHRDEQAEIARKVVASLPFFRELVEMERTTLSARSRRLFTFSALYGANVALLSGLEFEPNELIQLAADFWSIVSRCLPEWEMVRLRRQTAGEVREDFIHTHGVVLQAIGRAGNALIKQYPKAWQKRLADLSRINWARTNSKVWEGRAMVGGRLSKATQNVILTGNAIKTHLKLDLTPEEQKLETALRSARRDR